MRLLTKMFLAGAATLSLSLGALADDDVDISKLPPASTKKVDFAKNIQPLLEGACLKCHGPKKPKSKYRMDTRDAMIKGGSSKDAAIHVGKSDKSPLVFYIADLVEEMEMPPLDKREKYPALTKEQIGLMRGWIDQGAEWPKGVTLKFVSKK